MGYLIFRGYSTQDLGLLVVQMPSHKKPPARHTEYVVQGKNGTMHTFEGYDAFDMPCTLSLFRADANVRDVVNAWADGTGDLISSDNLAKCWKASVLRVADYGRREYDGKFYDTVKVTFRCQPIMRESVPETYKFTKTTIIGNKGNVEALPTIVVKGSGTCVFSVAGQEITLENVSAPVTIDCDAGYVYTAEGAVSMKGEFPRLPLGDSTIEIKSGVTELQITPNWGWL